MEFPDSGRFGGALKHGFARRPDRVLSMGEAGLVALVGKSRHRLAVGAGEGARAMPGQAVPTGNGLVVCMC